MKILAFAASLRKESFNKKLIRFASDLARKQGSEVTLIDLKDYPLPFYNSDEEISDGWPPSVKRLRELFLTHDAVMIACPEYNASVPAVLKNLIDWLSRDGKGGPLFDCYKGKRFAIMSASPGKRGGVRSLADLRPILEEVGAQILPIEVTIASAHRGFDEKGELIHPADRQALEAEIKALLG